MFALWVAGAMVVSALISAALLAIAPRGETTRRSEAGMWVGLVAVFFGIALAVRGAFWVIELAAAALGF